MTESIRECLAAFRSEGRIPCARAVDLARTCGVSASEVGRLADGEGIRVCACQLGLFGYEAFAEKQWASHLASVPRLLEDEIRAACIGGRLPCGAAWRIADECGLPRLVLGSAAETLGLRISACQLGCFE